ncbi:hypothetical protein X975_17259, partial [Stegodyphus mimosarum]
MLSVGHRNNTTLRRSFQIWKNSRIVSRSKLYSEFLPNFL